MWCVSSVIVICVAVEYDTKRRQETVSVNLSSTLYSNVTTHIIAAFIQRVVCLYDDKEKHSHDPSTLNPLRPGNYNTMQCNAMQCNAMQCNAMQCNAMQCNAMQCNAMQCNAMQCNAILFNGPKSENHMVDIEYNDISLFT